MGSDDLLPEWIPRHLPEQVREQIFGLTRPVDAGSADIECSEHLIRHWCEAVEDGNPLYVSSEFAQSLGFRDIVAPPAMVMGTLSTPYRWPWPGKHEAGTGGGLHYRLKKLMNLPVGVVVDNEVEFFVSSRSAIACFAQRGSCRSPDRRRPGSAKAGSGSSRRACRTRGARSSARCACRCSPTTPLGSATLDEDDQEADGRHPATEECLRADDVSHPEGLATSTGTTSRKATSCRPFHADHGHAVRVPGFGNPRLRATPPQPRLRTAAGAGARHVPEHAVQHGHPDAVPDRLVRPAGRRAAAQARDAREHLRGRRHVDRRHGH